MEKFKSIMTEIAVAIIILLVICAAALVDIKSRESSTVSQAMQDMDITLKQYKESIDNLGSTVKKESVELQKLKDKMNTLKSGDAYRWNQTVVSYNNKLTEYNEHMNEYNEKIKDYNKNYKYYENMKRKNENIIEWIKTIIGIN
ncbi:hypothetical protein [Clostridium luticellarii]|jgi:chromosome segregation ATPase|uniref:Uncharacterized protein n=1 Tax=Clostridium luticellarii TaxID=1691940 RepID=A0A2T0BG73_9CLOT|nr:hypothetical protein [Clostridium luticellarii]MCI1944854.1 hypothetical protein [Clostridium luticellarii]MCI1968330.1 hypothetical protein [Clostridium luticellarii]MCI1995328.1 hypothetical protein [Clostridium luticellarii]MCI2039410.1 hypothetical protein [Clostridium luticellarii]PRR82869.1 hypothetical protein CLLU_27550 [Clostridium luticellarii]